PRNRRHVHTSASGGSLARAVAGGVRIGAMEAKNADLAGLRINRSTESAGAVPRRRAGRWLAIGVPAAVIVVLVVVLLTGGGAFGSALPVRLTPATMVSPARAGAMLVASGYVVAQRKAAVASKGTGRIVYLGFVEGDRVRAGQVIARIEDADVKAQLAQAQANVEVSRAELHDAERSLARERLLADSGFSSQASLDAAEARYQRVQAGIASAGAAVEAAQVALENTVIRAPFDGTVLTKNADVGEVVAPLAASAFSKSEEHTSELQSRENLVCRLLLEKKNTPRQAHRTRSLTRSGRARCRGYPPSPA